MFKKTAALMLVAVGTASLTAAAQTPQTKRHHRAAHHAKATVNTAEQVREARKAAAAAEDRAARTESEVEQLKQTLARQSQQIEQLEQSIQAQKQAAQQAQQTVQEQLPQQDQKIQQVQQQVQSLNQTVSQVKPEVEKVQADTNKRVSALENVVNRSKISGDFRVRFDGIDRSSLAGGAGAMENLRWRYRLRLNYGFQVDKNLSVHAQLASGPVNNQLTDNQDFGNFGAKNPISINRAYVTYTPTKWIEINGGRIPEIFGESSQFSFDPDLNFNGGSEVLKFGQAGKSYSGIFTAAQYILTNPNKQQTNPQTTLRLRTSAIYGEGLRLESPEFNDMNVYYELRDFAVAHPNQIATEMASGAGIPGVGYTTDGLAGSGNLIIKNPDTNLQGVQPYVFVTGFNTAEMAFGFNHKPLAGTFLSYGAEVRVDRNLDANTKRDGGYIRAYIGSSSEPGQVKFIYTYKYAEADSMLSAFTDDDLGTQNNTDIKAHAFMADWKLMKHVNFQNIFFIEKPINIATTFNGTPLVKAVAPQSTTYRLQSQILLSF